MTKTELKTLKKNKIGLCMEDRVMYFIVSILLVLLILVIAYPIIYVLSSSFSSGTAVSSGRVILWPVDFSVDGYKIVFQYSSVWRGFANSLFYTTLGTAINLFMTTLAAYPLSRRNFQGRRIYMSLFIVTLFFQGGIIPTYILVKNLGMNNTFWAILIPTCISTYNMIIMRTFFQSSIPGELQEAAMLDGCSDIRYLVQIVLPLSKAVMSVLLLYYAVGHWNSYYSALIYLRKSELFPLQLVLRQILIVAQNSTDMSQVSSSSAQGLMQKAADTMRYALIVMTTVPIMIVYPVIQKYFEKGVMIGSVKG